jgi:hypothetical protein
MSAPEGAEAAPPAGQELPASADPAPPVDAAPTPDPDTPLFTPPEMEAITLGDEPQNVTTLDNGE